MNNYRWFWTADFNVNDHSSFFMYKYKVVWHHYRTYFVVRYVSCKVYQYLRLGTGPLPKYSVDDFSVIYFNVLSMSASIETLIQHNNLCTWKRLSMLRIFENESVSVAHLPPSFTRNFTFTRQSTQRLHASDPNADTRFTSTIC